ncbi:hypothetical protein ACS0TY_012902 [Phlomoides rotata]
MAGDENPLLLRLCDRLIPEISAKLPGLIAAVLNDLVPINPLTNSIPAAVSQPPAVTALNDLVVLSVESNKKLVAHDKQDTTTVIQSRSDLSIPGIPSYPLAKGTSNPTIIPSSSVAHTDGESDLAQAPVLAKVAPLKSYANIVRAASSTQVSAETLQAMKPVWKGLYLTVAIDEDLHKKGVLELRDSLIGRVIHARGDKPLSQEDLIKKLGDIWGIRTPCNLIPIGEGYYNIQFSCGDDGEKIFAKRTWKIKSGFLRLQRWVPEFNPYKVSSSVAQNPNIITALASAVGTVINLDERTTSRSMGRFAQVLVELDLKHDREEYVTYERAGHMSEVYILASHNSKHSKKKVNTLEPKWVQRNFRAPKPSKNVDKVAPNIPYNNSFGALDGTGLADAAPHSADDPGTGSEIDVGVQAGLISIQGLEVQLPPIEDHSGTGNSHVNNISDQPKMSMLTPRMILSRFQGNGEGEADLVLRL